MLTQCMGSSNSETVFRHLVGERIVAAFRDGTHLVLQMESGPALVLTSLGGETSPAYFVEAPEETQKRANRRRAEIRRMIEELRDVTPTSWLEDLCQS